jgi:AcrR family transcriptional regulator
VVECTRDRILDATERLLGRLGYQKTTMDDIAAEAGVARRTIYLHFPNKEEVALATIDRGVERLQERLRAAARGPGTWEDRLRAMLAIRVLFRFDSVRDYYHGIDEIFRSLRAAYMARRARYFDEEAAILAEVLVQGRDAGAFAFDDPKATAHALLLALNALPSNLSTRELGERREVEARVARITDLLLHGLCRREPPQSRPPTPLRRAVRGL